MAPPEGGLDVLAPSVLVDPRLARVDPRDPGPLVTTAGGLLLDYGEPRVGPANIFGAACGPLPSLSVRNLTVTNCRQQSYFNVATGLDALTVPAAGIRIWGGFQRAELEDCVVDGVWRAAAVKPGDGAGAGIDIHPDTVRRRYCRTTVVRGCTVANVLQEVPGEVPAPGGAPYFRQTMDGPVLWEVWALPDLNEDMDGLKVLTLKSVKDSSAVVEGCRFVDCEFRAIKTQVASTSVTGCEFLRTRRRGHVEIDAQFGRLLAAANTITWRGFVAGGGINLTCRAAHPRGRMDVVGNTFVYEWAGGWGPPRNHYPVQATAEWLRSDYQPPADEFAGGEDDPEYHVIVAQAAATNSGGNFLDHVLVRDNILQVVPVPGLAASASSLDAPCCALLSLAAADGGDFLVDSNHVPGCVLALVSLGNNGLPQDEPTFRGGLVDNESDIPTLGVLVRHGVVLVRGPWHDNANIDEDPADRAAAGRDLWRCPL